MKTYMYVETSYENCLREMVLMRGLYMFMQKLEEKNPELCRLPFLSGALDSSALVDGQLGSSEVASVIANLCLTICLK